MWDARPAVHGQAMLVLEVLAWVGLLQLNSSLLAMSIDRE